MEQQQESAVETLATWAWEPMRQVTVRAALLREQGGYVVTRSTVSTEILGPITWETHRTGQRQAYRTREAAEMAYADTAHALRDWIVPEVDEEVVNWVRLGRGVALYDEGAGGLELRRWDDVDECDCPECGSSRDHWEDGPHSKWLALDDEDIPGDVDGDDDEALIERCQRLVTARIAEEEQPVPERVTDPAERARIEAAEAAAAS